MDDQPEQHVHGHQLDFAWLFSRGTVQQFFSLGLVGRGLAIGCPSIAAAFNADGFWCELIERNPFASISLNLPVHMLDIRWDYQSLLGSHAYDWVIIDPPWYPKDIKHWMALACHAVRPQGKVYSTLWRPDLRDTARSELADLGAWFSNVGTWETIEEFIEYSAPHFEQVSAFSAGKALTPRLADLLQLAPRTIPLPEKYERTPAIWHRFRVDHQQLAILVREDSLEKLSRNGSLLLDFSRTLANTSRRNTLTAECNIWSSSNRVDRLRNPSYLVSCLDDQVGRKSPVLSEGVRRVLGEFLAPLADKIEVLEKWTHRK